MSLSACGVMLALLMMVLGPCEVLAQGQASNATLATVPASTPLGHLPLQRESGSGNASDSPSLFLQAGIAVFLAIALGGVFKLRQHRLERAGVTPGLQSIQTLRLTQHASLHVVQWDGREMLVACTAQHVELLACSLSHSEAGSEA